MTYDDIDRASSALAALDPGVDRDGWIRIGMAFKAAGGSFEDWHAWSATAGNYKSEADCRAAWCSIREDGPVRAATLFALARKAGWQSDGHKQDRPRQKLQEAPQQTKQDLRPPFDVNAAWKAGEPATESFPYIASKQGTTTGLRVYRGSARIAGQALDGAMMVPSYDMAGNLQTVQFILESGRKLNAPGRPVKGAFVVGRINPPSEGLHLAIVEGIGQGWACNRATGMTAVVAFGAGRMKAVASAFQAHYPSMYMVLVADAGKEDHCARIAKELGCAWVEMPAGSPQNYDINDLLLQEGSQAVADLLRNPKVPPQPADEQGLRGEATPEYMQREGEQTTATVAFEQPALSLADVRDGTNRTRPLTEYGNALRLLDQKGKCVRFVPETQGWLVWNDGWMWDPDGADVRMAAADLPCMIYQEGVGHKVADAEHFAKWARKSQSLRVVQAAVHMLSDQRCIRVPMAQIDADTMLLGFDNARSVIELRTGKSRPAVPSDYITKSLSVTGLGDAKKAVRWLQFLDQIFVGDTELIGWMQRWMGYMLTGSTAEQLLVFCYGLGSNGKSVLGELLRWIMGDYARAVPVEMLCESRRQAGGATPDLADLVGARLALTTETEDGAALAESLIKSLTAGDTISARPLYGKPFNFSPQFKLLMLGNHRPVVRGTDHGIWRRIRLVPFRRQFEGHEKDLHLLDKLKSEAPHILAWMVEGGIEWQHQGLADSPAVVAAETADYRQEQDVIGQWLSEETIADASSETPSPELYASYRPWAIEAGLKPASSVALGRRLGERGFKSRRSGGHTRWIGLRLKILSGPSFSRGKVYE